jgi:flagellar biogenesis protein FliO
MRHKASIFAWLIVGVLTSAVVEPSAAADSSLTGNLLPESDPVSMPSVARVVAGFIFTAVIAVGLVYALKRFLPRLSGKGFESNASHKVTARLVIHSGLQIHVVDIPGYQVIVAEGKGAISVATIPKANADEKIRINP